MVENIKRINDDTVEITTIRQVDLKKLREQIQEAQTMINALPKPKTKADKETLDFWNLHLNEGQKEALERHKQTLEQELERYK